MKLWPVLVATSILSASLGFIGGRSSVDRPPAPAPLQVAALPSVALPPAPPPPQAAALPPDTIAVSPTQAPATPPAVPPTAPTGVQALNLMRTVIDTKGAQALACLVFSAPLASSSDQNPSDFIRIEPTIKSAIQVAGDRLCLGGLAFGTSYKLTVLAGLRGTAGSATLSNEVLPLSLGDLPTSAEFGDDGFILPRDATGGLPIATVNLQHVHLRVDRITDRVLVRTALGKTYQDNNEYDPDTEQNVDTLGVPLWKGDLTVPATRNERIVTAFPLAQLLQPRLPGAYRITLVRKVRGYRGVPEDQNDYRWIFDTDLMLSTHTGADGLHVFVRSLKTAKPLSGTQVSLLAANNDELGRAGTDANGEAVFAPGLLRGLHGHLPRLVMAYQGDDFTALQLNKPGFDFSDRGVDGRPDPGPVDGFLYTDRGIYRPGETIDLTTVVRGRLAEPLPPGQAVSVVLHRPDGVEAGRWRLVPNDVGAAAQEIALKTTAPRGTWRLEEMLAGTTAVIGTLEVQVQDFVPNQLAVELATSAPRIAPDAPAAIAVNSRFLYGAPAPDLEVVAHVQLQRDTAPVAERSWQFGSATETLNTEAQDIPGPRTDAQGHSSISIDAADLKLPKTTLPLRADITVSVAEPGGRATETQTSLPVTTHSLLIGLRPPNPEGQINENSAAAVAVGVFGPEGTRLAHRVPFRLIEQVTQFHYFQQGNVWQWKTSTFDRPVTFGSLDVPATEGGATITLPRLQWGTYRLEVDDAASGAFTSIVLHAGFSPAPEAAESPEKVSVTLVGPPPLPGGSAKLHIKPPFAGEMLVTVENSNVLAVRTASIPESGADITVQTDGNWGVGAYVMASVYRPSQQAAGHAPVRAVGLAYVPLDATPRTIGVTLTAPPVLRPRTHFDLPVHVDGAAAKGPVWLTVAAVDEGILQLTRFASPDPNGHFFGKRRLAVDVRDDYAHLIDGNGAAPGEIRSGGDLDGVGLSIVPTKTTALFSGLVAVGPDGHAVVPIDLPDFTGGLRLMAVAVSRTGFGHADAQVPVRDPVVAQISLPRFLAPGDGARMTLLAHNVEAPAGTYHVHLAATGALAMPATDEDVTLAAQQALVKTYPLTAGDVGIGQVTLTLTGAGGLNIMHDWSMEVRTPFQSDTRVARTDQAPNESVRLTQDLASGFTPGGASVVASFSSVGNIDLAGLLTSLDEYPFGCSEQLVSRAMPMLYVEQEAAASLGVAPADLRLRVQDAVDKLLERQDEGGAFGLWRAGDGQAEPYLGGLIIDFLMRARAHGYTVPDAAVALGQKALTAMDGEEWMLHRFWAVEQKQTGQDERMVAAGKVYALLLAARAGQADPGDLRYENDTSLRKLEPLGQAQLAVALSIAGDTARAVPAFDAAERGLATERDDLGFRTGDFYRTRLRDTAALVSLAAEMGDRPRVTRLLQALDRFDMRTERLTTQEQGWLIIAAGTLLETAGPVSVTIDGTAQTPPRAVVTLRRDVTALGTGIEVKNIGTGPVSRFVSVHGLPLRAPPASSNGIEVHKTITDANGKPVDLAHLKQNSRLVVHLSGRAGDTAYHQTMLVDPLPAGFEIERVVAASTDAAANGLPWLGDITPTRTAEKRDDRFMAAIDLSRSGFDADTGRRVANPAFNVAYVVRVVSPGQFVLPAASIRDMYRPDVQARGSVDQVTVEVPH